MIIRKFGVCITVKVYKNGLSTSIPHLAWINKIFIQYLWFYLVDTVSMTAYWSLSLNGSFSIDLIEEIGLQKVAQDIELYIFFFYFLIVPN